MAAYCFRDEPIGNAYRTLLRQLWPHARTFSLVVRKDLGSSNRLTKCLEDLERSRIETRMSESWPGTGLIGRVAEVHIFNADQQAFASILKHSVRLFEWLQPELPEDLAVYHGDGSVLLETIAHERDGRVYMSKGLLGNEIRHMIEECEDEKST